MNPQPAAAHAPGPIVAYLAGATAVGKSDVALLLAAKLGLEIVSIDSRQIYRGLPIGTAQPSPAERAAVRHHLLDLLDPIEPCSAGAFRLRFGEVLDDLKQRGARGLAVGGTGLYWEAITRGLHPLPPASREIRARHEEILRTEGTEGLRRRLEELDPTDAARIGRRDRQRLSRALEVLELTGRGMEGNWRGELLPPMVHDVPAVVLSRGRGDLYRRIEQRCDRMLALGLLDEVRQALARGFPEDAPGLRTVGVRELLPFLRGEVPLQVARDQFVRNSRRYAKRQETWIRHHLGDATQIPVAPDTTPEATMAQVIAHLETLPGVRLDTPGGAG
ncbi:MAG: tRNA (adenosine(37)-N6)-dimethylallyltransferase MiaA [Candidatus Eisenbacteria bacterium]|nr:tRNA (adenosine(37)-N6)-dimethylallyltransferase MiaA [Candidatus Eisenbacteria bacterium]